jgi:VCBS repeat-containing protein
MKSLLAISLCAVCLVPAAQGQLFSDDFARGTDPGPLTPWRTNSGGGNWTVTGGVIKGGINPASSYGTTFITNIFTNFSVQARMQFPVGAFGGGLGGRLDPAAGTRYAAWVYPENATGDSNVLRLIKFTSYSSFTLLQQTNLAAVGTNFHTVKLEFSSANQINVYFDSNKVVSATEPTPYASGAVSLEFWTGATGYFFTVDDVAVNAIPLGASNDTYTAVSGLRLRTSAPGVLGNDTGGLGPLTASLVNSPTHGTFTLTNNGGFTYTATNGYTGADSFTYRATDGVSTSSVATASITVTADHAPVANSDAYSLVQNTTLTVAAPGVLANDTDVDGNSLTAAVVSGVSHGALSLSTNGGFTYTPTAGFAGMDAFTYRANDALSNSTPATVTISVLSIVPLYSDNFSRTNLSPWVAQLGSWAVTNGALQGGTNTSSSYGVAYLTNTWSNYSVQASIQLPAGAFGGGVDACLNTTTGARYAAWIYPEGSPGGANTLKLIKFQDWTTFGYNSVGAAPIQSVNLTSVGTNLHTLKLACAGSRIAVFFDGTLMISVTDMEAQPYSSGASGADFWTGPTGYRMSVDDVLVASLVNGDGYSALQNTALTVAAPGVLANDTEIAGTTLTAVQVAGPTNGALSLSGNGGFTYTPTTGYTGPDSFTYQANDGAVNLGTATVNLTVSAGGVTENFDAVTAPALPSAWTTSANGVGSPWVTRTTTNDTAPNAAFVPDPADIGTSDLVSPPTTLPPGQSRLSFRHNYSLENQTPHPTSAYDGGVLEIKIGADPFTDILAAGGSFVTNGYNATISSEYGNSLSNRPAWSGSSGGFITTTANLPAAAMGQTIQLRWRCATDNDNGYNTTNGWFIDTVSITNCLCACCWNTPPLLLPALTDQTIDELTLLTVNNAATDPDLPTQTLTYSLISPPSGATIGTNTGIITWTPSQNQSPSTNTLATKVTDSGSPALSATNRFIVTVREVNVAPSLPVIPARTVNELALMTVTNTATNANIHSTVSGYRLVNPPTGASINASGIITWTPSQTQSPSTNTFTTVVTNSNPYDLIHPRLTATNSFTVTVREVNVAPSLPVIPNQTISALGSLTVTNTATNANLHSTITGYRLANSPGDASISGNGIITWTPSQSQIPSTNTFTTVVTNSNPYDLVNPQLTATNTFLVYAYGGAFVVVDSATLVAEGFFPTNNAIDPGETVSLLFALKNAGGADTTNLVVTLLPANGVTAPTGPQTYGALPAGGSAVSQPFTFTTSGTCGGTISPTLQLQDGTANLGNLTVSFALGLAGNVFTQNFDTVTAPALPSGWTTSTTGVQSPWVTRTTTNDTAPNAAFAPDAANVGTSALVSPAIVLPWGQLQLTFRNNYNLEFDNNGYYDGGALEIRIGAGTYIDIVTAGGSFVRGGYNGTISTGFGSPIAGRQAWSSNSVGFVTTVVNLPAAAAGQTVQLRWLCATDNGNGNNFTNGWYIDSIGISGQGCATNTPPVLPAQLSRTIDELTTLTVTNTAGDLESPPEVLTYALAVAPTNAVISTNGGVITWTPTQQQSPSTNTITTVVRDNALPSASATNSFTVVVREVNLPPTLPNIADQTVNVLTLLTLTNAATNSNIHSAIAGYALVNPPAGATIDPAGIFTWTPSQNQSPSTNTITTVVTNTNPYDLVNPRLTATNSFKLLVLKPTPAPAPVIQSVTISNGLVTITWSAVSGNKYRLQCQDGAPGTNWYDLPPELQASGPTATCTNAPGSTTQRFYRVYLMP